MYNQIQTFLIKKWRLLAGLCGLIILFLLLALIPPPAKITTATPASSTAQNSYVTTDDSGMLPDSPNAVANLALTVGNGLSAGVDGADKIASGTGRTLQLVAGGSGRFVAHALYRSVVGVGQAVAACFSFAGHTTASLVVFAIVVPSHTLGFVSDAPVLNAVIRPVDHAAVPIIDADSPALVAAKTALPATATGATTSAAGNPTNNPATLLASQIAAWPIHGTITTEFGVPEWPYQAVHTGIDISDGTRPGTTPVHAFRRGTVLQTIYGGGLGNHVIVDHGGGVTSVYGHLNSISVVVGQQVDTSTTLGLEGTTGVSTGTHVHFEIRVDGQAANPHQFITGQP